MTRALSFAFVAMLAFAACGNESTPADAASAANEATPTEPASVPAAEAESLEPKNELTGTAGRSDGEKVEAATTATSPVAAAIAANTPAPPQGDLGRWKSGQHFTAYPVAQPVSTPPGTVEVVEGFWYGCGHCYNLEPRLVAWEQGKPEWIRLRRVPVVWNEVTRADARLYYTIESLGLLEKLHTEVFREIHARGRPLTVIRNGRVDAAATEKAARDFLASHGVSAEDFGRHYRTFSTETKLRQAENLSRRYLLEHTPMMVVHGKYLTDIDMAGGTEQLFQLINDLAARERGA